jgi:hypothetical protein
MENETRKSFTVATVAAEIEQLALGSYQCDLLSAHAANCN